MRHSSRLFHHEHPRRLKSLQLAKALPKLTWEGNVDVSVSTVKPLLSSVTLYSGTTSLVITEVWPFMLAKILTGRGVVGSNFET
jgi:hypothetical protein